MVRLDSDRIAPRISCIECDSEQVRPVGGGRYECQACRATRPRAVIIDPALRWWIAADGEYWHETAGIFVRNPGGEYLLFRRTKFPFGLTVPAGHIEVDETPAAAAERELSEETGLSGRALDGLGDVDLVGDSCRRGADIHRWHVFITEVDEHTDVAINDEGTEPVWLTPSSLAGVELTPAVTMLVERYRRHLG